MFSPYSILPSIGAFEGDPFASIGTLETNASTVSIYPNPSNGIFSVDLGEKHEVSKFTLLDVYGRVIQSRSKLQDQVLILKINEPAGVYLLILVRNEERNLSIGKRLIRICQQNKNCICSNGQAYT